MGRLFSDTPESQCGKHSRCGDLCQLRNRTRGIAQSSRLLLQGLRTAIWLRVFVEQQDGDSRRCRRFLHGDSDSYRFDPQHGLHTYRDLPQWQQWHSAQFPAQPGSAPLDCAAVRGSIGVERAGVSGWQGREARRPPASYNVNLSIQRQLSSSMVLETSYNAVIGAHLQDGVLNYNQVNPAYLAKDGAALLTSPINSSAAIAAGITPPFPGFQQL